MGRVVAAVAVAGTRALLGRRQVVGEAAGSVVLAVLANWEGCLRVASGLKAECCRGWVGRDWGSSLAGGCEAQARIEGAWVSLGVQRLSSACVGAGGGRWRVAKEFAACRGQAEDAPMNASGCRSL